MLELIKSSIPVDAVGVATQQEHRYTKHRVQDHSLSL
jgi:hypothetical protein